jgi:LEA14-like dessication related protein
VIVMDRALGRSRDARLFTLIAVMALAVGCASMDTLEPPEVTLVDIRSVEMTVFETTLETKLRVTNPNPEPLAVEGAAFKLYLDGKKVGSGTSPDRVEVPRLSSALLRATVHINNASALLRLKEILEERELHYGLRGKLFVTRPNGTARIKIEREGRLDLDQPLKTPDALDAPELPGTSPISS